MGVDKVLKNAKIITMDCDSMVADWVAIEGDKIHSVGKGDDYPEAKEVEDLYGKVLLPGLFDNHCHVMTTGFFLDGVNLSGMESIEEVLAKIKEACEKASLGEWIFAVGFNSYLNAEKRYPTRWEIDEISSEHPVLITTQTLHGCVLNSKALEVLQIPDIEGVVKNEKGEKTGVLLSDESAFIAQSKAIARLSDEKIFEYIKVCADYATTKGVTSMSGFFGQFDTEDRDVSLVIKRGNELPIDMTLYYQTWDVDKVMELGLPRIGGCLTLDGAGFEFTMALSEPYPSKPERRGFLIHTDNEVYQLISKAHENNIQCSLHALGDRAIDQLLYIYLQVIGEQGKKDLRHRVEHFSLPTEKHMDLLSELGLIASMQPAFSGLWGDPVNGEYVPMLGKERADRMEVFPEIIARNGIICGGSDSPVTLVDPLFGIASLISNPDPRRNVPVDEAIKVFTINAAYANGTEANKGSIETGKDADFTLISDDPYKYSGKVAAYDIHVLETIRKGKTIYRKA